jgi:hypothetical protein
VSNLSRLSWIVFGDRQSGGTGVFVHDLVFQYSTSRLANRS